ncbi:ADP-ribosyltransferase domain-containing protein, partial [Serratia ureilytica]
SEKVDIKQLKKELISLNSGDRHWEKGPYGSEIIDSVYNFYNANYDEVGNRLESYLTANSKSSSDLLYRGTTADEFSQWMKGIYMATGFVPTSHVESTAKGFGQYIIEIENGYGKNVRNIYQNGYEAEFLINRGSKFKFISNSGDKRIRVRQIF